MDYNEILDKQYWEEILSDLDRKDSNSARRYRRYNRSLEAMGEKTVIKERKQYQFAVDEYKAFDALLGFMDTIENEKLLKALKKLKPVELQIIIYRFEHKMQVSEIAKVLNRGVSTVSERLGRILYGLISEMEKK
jgi:DNA-directed RNA polymerase specialized sigma24 family protein